MEIHGIKYDVIMRKTADDFEAEGKPNLAGLIREHNQVAHLYLKQPKGSCTFFVVEHRPGFYGDIVQLTHS